MALEKPYILPTRAEDDQDPVNFNHFSTFVKQDIQRVGNNASSTSGSKKVAFTIAWMPNPNAQEGQIIVWRYPDEKCRNADYSELISKISVPLGLI